MICRFLDFVKFARWSWRLVHMTESELDSESMRTDLTPLQRDCLRDEREARAAECAVRA